MEKMSQKTQFCVQNINNAFIIHYKKFTKHLKNIYKTFGMHYIIFINNL
jgi:hypothetical protein